ncbi:hypothetical protein ACTMS0_03155 [Micromonospora sp. H33]|uniref:hypothetical protein n=1 Tax=Micromonospora sp. H33 TaxID=3452215 RepID=UPI003F8AE0EE
MRPVWMAPEQRRGADVWRRSQRRYTSTVLGPSFEETVRQWALRFADPETIGGVVVEATPGRPHRSVDPARIYAGD